MMRGSKVYFVMKWHPSDFFLFNAAFIISMAVSSMFLTSIELRLR